MDESHRLLKYPMPIGYNENLFNEIYNKTEKLRSKLVWEINSHKLGVDPKEISSWFDVKLIHSFNKYYNDDRVIGEGEENRAEKLKAFVINALRTFKLKIVKDSYHEKNNLFKAIDIAELYDYDLIEDNSSEPTDSRIELIKKYYKDRLNDGTNLNAYTIFELELNPPPYIIERLNNPDKKRMPKITNDIIADYLGIPYNTSDDVDWFDGILKSLRKQISDMESQCRDYFKLGEEG